MNKKKFRILSPTIENLKSQLEQMPTDKKVYLLFKQPGEEVYKNDAETYSSPEEFRQIKGLGGKDKIVIFQVASEDPNIEYKRNESTDSR